MRGVTLASDAFRDDLLALSEYADGRQVRAISGYRSQAKQNQLRATGNTRAALLSQHTIGSAADIYIDRLNHIQAGATTYNSGLFNRVNVYSSTGAIHVDNRAGFGGALYYDWNRVN